MPENSQPLVIDYYSDVLCVWAYIWQERVDSLMDTFGDTIAIRSRYLCQFATMDFRVQKQWAEKGGIEGLAQKQRGLCAKWPHISLANDAWVADTPASSASAHIYLKAAQLVELGASDAGRLGQQGVGIWGSWSGRTPKADALAWSLREGFFAQGKNLSRRKVQDAAAESVGFSPAEIAEVIDDGRAHAALFEDLEMTAAGRVAGSPSLVMDKGRVTFYGDLPVAVLKEAIANILARDAATGTPSRRPYTPSSR